MKNNNNNNNSAESSVKKNEFSPLESLGHQSECKSCD